MATDRFGEPLVSEALLRKHLVYLAGENAWQQRARLLQSLWRQDHGWAPGSRAADYVDPDAERLGSRLDPTIAAAGANFLTSTAWQLAQHALETKETGALISQARLMHDLLSSQPLCFNAFAGLDSDHDLATRVLADLLPEHGITGVTPGPQGHAIRFEHSPGRGRTEYAGDHSAFDVAIGYESPRGRGLLGIEVKYHENLAQPDRKTPDFAGWFPEVDAETLTRLQQPPLVQLARDHRLARAVARQDRAMYPAGVTWVLLYPAGNTAVARAIETYRSMLPLAADLAVFTLEDFVDSCARHCDATWPAALRARYLNTERAVASGVPPQHPAASERRDA